MDKRIKSLEQKLLGMEQLREKSERFKLVNKQIKEYLHRVDALDSRIQSIDSRITNYDLVDFLSSDEIDMSKMSLGMVVSAMKDLLGAEEQFKGDGAAEYLQRCKELWRRIRKMGFLRLNEVIYKDTESLMADTSFGEFVGLLGDDLVHRIQVKILQSRKVECLRKSVHIRSNKEFLFRSMIQQELFIFLKLFPQETERLGSRLRMFMDEKPLAESGLFECFSFSVLKEYFAGCSDEEVEGLEARLCVDLSKDEAPSEKDLAESGEFYAGALMLISARYYLSTRQGRGAQAEVVEI